MRCKVCYGSGKVLGGGMITRDCYECHGAGYVPEPIPNKVKIKRSSKQYKDAIKKIKDLDSNITDTEAQKIFDTELANIAIQEGKQKQCQPEDLQITLQN